MHTYAGSNIAETIEKMEALQDKDYFMKILWDIALNHNNLQLGEQVVISSSDKDGITVDSIESHAINCVRGITIRAISKMLWDDSKLYENYRDNIDAISCDRNPIIRYEEYDYLIGMDTWNIRNMNRIVVADPDHKIHKLLEYTNRGGDIADPWYTGNFDETYRDVSEGCEGLLAHILKEDMD